MEAQLSLDSAHTAVLIMDYQTEVVGRMVPTSAALLDRAASVLEAARGAGVPVIYVVIHFREGYPEINPRNRTFGRVRESGLLQEGTPGVAIHAAVAPRPGDVVVVKRRVGAFGTSDLDVVLRGLGVSTLVMLGVATSGVVLSTLRWAADADYELVLVEDCCADRDEEVHRVLTQKVFPAQAAVVQAQQVIDALIALPRKA
jgi:nicotinamidase-related amidase